MNIKSWGRFSDYIPEESAETEALLKLQVLFSRNEDGVDFYALRKQFAAGSVIASVNDEGQIVAAGYSPDGMFPSNGLRLVELSGPDMPSTLQEIVGKILDFTTSSLVSPPNPQRASLFKTEVYERMTDAELEIFDAAIHAADLRTRRMWDGCLQIEAASPFFITLRQAMERTFGSDRTDAILSLEEVQT